MKNLKLIMHFISVLACGYILVALTEVTMPKSVVGCFIVIMIYLFGSWWGTLEEWYVSIPTEMEEE